ncbi:hypothetical protein N7453_002122 [Penicillium expansum]|nr:hypothetical protein N7453_002122 [Penicillium expansum]
MWSEPTFHNTQEEQAEIDKIENWEDVICDVEEGWGWPELWIEKHFHRPFISHGYAARRMPLLKSIKCEVDSYHKFTLYLRNTVDELTLGWECYHAYRLDSWVAKAWDFDLDNVKT